MGLIKVRRTIEIEVGDLPRQLSSAAYESRKSVVQICKDAGISHTYWYDLVSGRLSSVTESTLKKIEKALGANFNINFGDKT